MTEPAQSTAKLQDLQLGLQQESPLTRYTMMNTTVPLLRIYFDGSHDLRKDFRLSRETMNTLMHHLNLQKRHGWGHHLEVLILVYRATSLSTLLLLRGVVLGLSRVLLEGWGWVPASDAVGRGLLMEEWGDGWLWLAPLTQREGIFTILPDLQSILAFEVLRWVGSNLTTEQHVYNYQHSWAQKIIENTFGIMESQAPRYRERKSLLATPKSLQAAMPSPTSTVTQNWHH
ncbi:hypothetical protein JZ751_016897 [Albula glossodonta]|uniref:Uncharacterized protein n=1 Tax=Albula glossodonta TaxID=121402 RepID=A0A8T2N1T7_9TELE|nr:hypothetical protein JZ751_016897 [Albula glossodonta]